MVKTKTTKKKPARNSVDTKPRRLSTPVYRSFQLSKRIRHPAGKLTGSFKLFMASWRHIWLHKRLFFGISLVYLVLTALFVKGLELSGDISELQDVVKEAFVDSGQFLSSLTLFGLLVSSTGSTSTEVGGAYQTLLLVLVSLALIWGLRQTHANERVAVRDTFYRGMYPLVPFMLVVAIIGLQLIPLIIGSGLYGIVTSNGLAVTFIEKAVWVLLFGLLALLSLYMVTSSVFALYIVTLPDMTPLRALRSARELVRYRRWTIMRKVLFLPLILLIIGAVIMVPLLLTLTVVAEVVFFALTMLGLAVVHSYMYSLYRELL